MYAPGTMWPTTTCWRFTFRETLAPSRHALPRQGLGVTQWLVSGLEFVVFGLLVFEFKFLRGDLAISIPVLVGEHILHDHLSIKTRSEFPLARCHLGMNVLWELERKGTGQILTYSSQEHQARAWTEWNLNLNWQNKQNLMRDATCVSFSPGRIKTPDWMTPGAPGS